MDVQATGQIMLGRRGLLAWGGRLAGAGAVGAFLPGMAWAQAAEKYPTIKAEFDSYVSCQYRHIMARLFDDEAHHGHGRDDFGWRRQDEARPTDLRISA